MPFVCDHCDHEFEPSGGEESVRCPKCLRRHGVRVREDGPEEGEVSVGGVGAAKGHLWLFAIVAAAVGAVGYLAVKGPGALGAKGDKGAPGAPKDPVAAATARAENVAQLQAAQKALDAGDLKQAYNSASAVLEHEPKNPQAREVMGDTLVKSGAAKEGLKEYEAALSIEATGARHYKAGKTLIGLGDVKQAAQNLKKALEMEPGAAWAAEVKRILGEMGDAAGELGAAPGDPDAPSDPAGGTPKAP